MRNNIKQLLAQQGLAPVINAIAKSKQDLKQLGYTRFEIKETIKEWFFGLDSTIDIYIKSNF